MSPKQKTFTEPPVPIRIGAATRANLETIKSTGLAKDDSAAFRAAAAALARQLADDPRIWIVSSHDKQPQHFGTRPAAVAWLQAQGATPDGDGDGYRWRAADVEYVMGARVLK